jgi:hypothetical protein
MDSEPQPSPAAMRGLATVPPVCRPCGALDTVHGRHSGGCGDSSTELEFPSDNVYRRDDRGIVGVESFGAEGLAFVIIHTSVGHAACRYGSRFSDADLGS